MAGAFSALTGTSIWLIVATFLNLPVSGTHSIVGATIGYALVAMGAESVGWATLGKIGKFVYFTLLRPKTVPKLSGV